MRDMQKLWENCTGFKHPIISFVWVLTHPKLSLRLIQFAIKVMVIFGVKYDAKKEGGD